jgi:deoxyribonuclease V
MLACVDVDYRGQDAIAACVMFQTWLDQLPSDERVAHLTNIAPYEPGQFYRRELPCLLTVLQGVVDQLETIVVDGYVWLQDEQTPGLGAHLYHALAIPIPIIGVAKTRFKAAGVAIAVERGTSQNPLYVTAIGMELNLAAQAIRSMHGLHRIPTLLKRVDRLCRDHKLSGSIENLDQG